MIERNGVSSVTREDGSSYLSIHQLIKEELPIWVRNETQKVKGQGFYVLVSISPDVRTPGRVIPIPPGPDPVCLSELVPFEDLRRSNSLFSCLASGILSLVSPEEAEEYYRKNPKRREVVKKLMQSFDAATNAGTTGMRQFRNMIKRENPNEVKGVSKFTRGEVLSRVRWLVESYKDGIITKDNFVNEVMLLSSSGELESIDKRFIEASLGEVGAQILREAGVE